MIIETWNWNQLYWSASLVNFEFKNCKMNSLPHRDTHSPAWRLNALLVHIWCRFYFWLFATSKWCSGIAWAIAKSICARVYSLSPAWWVFLLVVFRFLSIFLHFSLAFGCGFLAIVAYIVHIYNVACVCCMHVAAQNKLRINTLENKGTAESRISLTSQYINWKKKNNEWWKLFHALMRCMCWIYIFFWFAAAAAENQMRWVGAHI